MQLGASPDYCVLQKPPCAPLGDCGWARLYCALSDGWAAGAAGRHEEQRAHSNSADENRPVAEGGDARYVDSLRV